LANAQYLNTAYKTNAVSFDVVYTKGDETNVYFTIGYLYGTTVPTAVTNVSYLPESDSTGTLTALTRYIAASGRYTIKVDVPDRVTYVVITFAATGGTPTGTVVIDGYMNQFRD
jgi:hypothetical protein